MWPKPDTTPQLRRRWAASATLVFLVAGCTSGAESATPDRTTQQNQQPVGSTSRPTTTPSTSAGTVVAHKKCLTSALTLTQVTRGAAAGNILDLYRFTNYGSNPCSLRGYPGVSVLDAVGRVVQHPADREPGPGTTTALPVVTVTLQSGGGSAEFLLSYTDNVPIEGCPSEYHGTRLRVYPPDNLTAIEIPFDEGFCDLSVGPVARKVFG